MTIAEMRERSLSLTAEIREAESRGDTAEVMRLMRMKQPLAETLYSLSKALEVRHG